MGSRVRVRFRFEVQGEAGFRADFRAADGHGAGEARRVDARQARRSIGRGMPPLPLGLDDDVARHQNLVPGDLDVVGRAGRLLPRAYHRLLEGQVGPGYLHRGVADLRLVRPFPPLDLHDDQVLPRQLHAASGGLPLLAPDALRPFDGAPVRPSTGRRVHLGAYPHARRRQGDVAPGQLDLGVAPHGLVRELAAERLHVGLVPDLLLRVVHEDLPLPPAVVPRPVSPVQELRAAARAQSHRARHRRGAPDPRLLFTFPTPCRRGSDRCERGREQLRRARLFIGPYVHPSAVARLSARFYFASVFRSSFKPSISMV